MSESTITPVIWSEEERMRRVGAFVCRLAQVASSSLPESPPPAVSTEGAGSDERVLAFLGGGREASPVEIRLTLGLSRSMTYRSLQRLSLGGQVASRGNTKAVVYRAVAVDPTRN